MTLKEKFENIKFSFPANESEKIAEGFAIGFAEWKDKNCYLVMCSESLFYVRDSEIHDDAYTRKELLEIYKKEQEL